MENKTLKNLSTVVLLILIGASFILGSCGMEEKNDLTPSAAGSSITVAFDEEGSAKIQKAQALAEKIQQSIPDEIFGGLYFDDEENLIVNVTDLENESVAKLRSGADMQDVEFREVKYSLAYLESVRLKITPFMQEYGIATVDANEATNKIHIELYEENEEVKSLVSEFIDWEAVTITVLPDDIKIVFT